MSGPERNVGRITGGALAAGLVSGVLLYRATPHPPRTPRRVRDLAALEEFLNRLVASGNPPGLSVAVVKDGVLAYERAFGMADGPRGIAATPDTVYHWWSMTKIPTAMAVLQLWERGQVRLDAAVRYYLPWFDVEPVSPSSPAITVRHLLNHSSGLPDTMPAMIGWVHSDDAGRGQTELVKQHLPRYRRLRFEPGSAALYSNLNSMVLGAVIEAVSGQSYEHYVVERVLRPLGMQQTDFVYTPTLAAQEAAGSLPVVHFYTPLLPALLDMRALVRERQGRLFWLRRVYLDATPSSGLIGSARDVARLMLAYLAGGELDGARVLAPDTVRMMTYEGHVGQRGLGWAVHREHQRLHVQHPGGGPGFATMLRLYPEERLGLVVLGNGTDLDYEGLADVLGSMDW
jgi:CubicO group peptidase (beta-lactamase class C family)